MNALEGGSSVDRSARGQPKKCCTLNDEKGPEALAAGKQRMPHRGTKPRGLFGGMLVNQRLQALPRQLCGGGEPLHERHSLIT
jgi:hypothetical protein